MAVAPWQRGGVGCCFGGIGVPLFAIHNYVMLVIRGVVV